MKIYNHCYCYISELYLFRFCLFIIYQKLYILIILYYFCNFISIDMNRNIMLNNLHCFIIFILIILRIRFFTSIYLFEKYELVNIVFIIYTFINSVFFALIFE